MRSFLKMRDILSSEMHGTDILSDYEKKYLPLGTTILCPDAWKKSAVGNATQHLVFLSHSTPETCLDKTWSENRSWHGENRACMIFLWVSKLRIVKIVTAREDQNRSGFSTAIWLGQVQFLQRWDAGRKTGQWNQWTGSPSAKDTAGRAQPGGCLPFKSGKGSFGAQLRLSWIIQLSTWGELSYGYWRILVPLLYHL